MAKSKSVGTEAEPGSDTVDPALAKAIAEVESDPHADPGWDRLEELADELQTPDEVLAAYRGALERGLARDIAPRIADRAVKFCQAWFIDTPDALPSLLTQIVERYPEIDWAFERLVVLLTSSAEWDQLLTLYDRSLAATRDEKKRRSLLEDASRLAKDFADQPDRAADYLQQLLRLDPGNEKLVTSLERLLERRERWEELTTLWREQLPNLSTDDARTTRAKIAQIALDKLGAPDRAVAELGDLVEENPDNRDACRQLELILGLEDASLEVRREALSLLRKTYEILERPEDVVRVLEIALGFVQGEDIRALRRECGNRLAILGRDTDAIAHYAALLHETPSDTDARRQLRQLSVRSGRRDLHVAALVEAAADCQEDADRIPLWLDAASVMRVALEDFDGAIDLYQKVLASADAEEADARRAAHQLNELLAKAERDAERLPVLERLSQIEGSPSFRRQIRGETARLAEQLGDDERALASWQQILAEEARDLEALDATISLLGKAERWQELTGALGQRAEAPVSEAQRRADRVQVARIQEEHLDEPEEAIATWRAIRESFGDSSETVAALDRLLTRLERWDELGDLLASSVTRERDEAAAHLVRLAELFATRLERPSDALPLFLQALELDPRDTRARQGAAALVDAGDAEASGAATALWRAYRRAGEWEPRLAMVDAVLLVIAEPAEQAELLSEAAKLQEEKADDPGAALASLCKAVSLEPRRRDLRSELLRVADRAEGWLDAALALRAAVAAFADDPASAAELRRDEARLLEAKLDDYAGAFEAFKAAAELAPEDAITLGHAARCAAHAAMWKEWAQATVASAVILGRLDAKLVQTSEQAASATDAWLELAGSLSSALKKREAELPPPVASKIHGLIAEWHRDRTGDAEAAKIAAQRAIELTPDDVGALERLVSLQRSAPGPELADTLLRVDAVGDERSLDALREAAAVTLESDPARAVKVLRRLYRKASDLWLAGGQASGSESVDTVADWALDQLTDKLLEVRERDGAAHLLLEGGELPLAPQRRAQLNRRAADLLVELAQPLRAVDALRRALADEPNDLDTIRKLAELSEREEQRSGSVALRERELALTDELDERLALRLAHVGRAAALEERSGRLEMLLANLADQPGHESSVDSLRKLLDERGHHGRLLEVLEEQAGLVASAGDDERAAALWTAAAEVAEKSLGDKPRAIQAHQQSVELVESSRALDALARLHSEREEHAEAAKWLRRRLDAAAQTERVAVLIKLAREHLKAGREGEAVSTLQTAFSEAPQSAEVRKQLLPLLRQREEWAALARTLAVSVEHAADKTVILNYAREAADLYHQRLDNSEEAVPVLRKAVDLAPEDRRLRALLGDSLRAAGELDEARTLLTGLIEDYGRRGSAERASAHVLLAKVLHDLGEHEEALQQLDVASKMDGDNVTIMQTMAQLARAAGQLERAEAALRTLLLTARRMAAENPGQAPIGRSEVLFELSSIATARGQSDQAEELAESAIEALSEDDTRAPQLQAKLREAGEHQLLLRLLESRLAYTRSPYRRGNIVAEKAAILEKLGRKPEAFDAWLEAIDTDPGSPLLHAGTRELAVELGKLDAYTEVLETVLDRARRDTDAMIRCEVMLRLGEIYEKERQDFARASELYDQAEATGVREVDVLRARARVAGARGDEEEQMRLLEHLASLGEDQVETRADALYRIAEVQLAADDSLEHGIESLRKALSDNSRPERACMILRRATEQHPEHSGLLDAYEQVARDSGDDTMLLHYLERRARWSQATPDQVREAVNKARDLGEQDRAEALMKHAVEATRERGEGLFPVDWALLGLAERCKDRGDVEGAVRWLEEAGEVADPEPLFQLSQEVAALATQGSDPSIAASLFERLRERDPTAREAWEPLVGIYAQLGDLDSLERVVRETLDGLQEVGDRNALRISLARGLLGDPARNEDAVQVLREALFDQPGHEEALSMLTSSLEKAGRTEELTELLRDQLIGAQDRGDAVTLKATSLRLGAMVERADAIQIYRDALAVGDDADILATLLEALGPDHDAPERAALGERLLRLQGGEEAATRARELAELYAEIGDAAGQLRMLEAGLSLAPGDEQIRGQLEQYYREQGDNAGLARILVATAESSEDPDQKVTLLREAAVVHRDQLNDAHAAVQLLEQAREIAPGDAKLCIELALALGGSGDGSRALEVLTEAYESAEAADKAVLLRARANTRAASGDPGGALDDLEEAYGIEPELVVDELVAALDERRVAAAEADDRDGERGATLRSVELMMARGHRDDALQLLGDWTQRMPDDLEALRNLRDLLAEDGRWHELERTCAQLIEIETGEEQVAAAALLLQACTQLGTPETAREPLERVWGAQPDSADIRAEVRRLYETIGAHQELARLLLDEARGLEDQAQKIEYLRWAGEALLASGDVTSAMPALTEVLELAPDDAKTRCLLADAYVLMGNFADAHALLDEAISSSKRTSPDLYMFHHRKAYIASAEGDHPTQLECLKKAHQSARKNGPIAAELADLAEALQQWDLAVATLRTITTLDAGECPISAAVALVRQARIALHQGDDKRARLCARRAAMTDAEAEGVQELLAELGET